MFTSAVISGAQSGEQPSLYSESTLSLAIGSRLGPYEILSPLGAGGMGEVYRARDTRLGRDVAVKVLPEHLSASADVRQRFEREARTISQLSHPHICALYDVGRENDVEYLVMELLEGETLSDRLAKGPLPLEQTLRYGQEIADALDRAHRQGIVHRDLKPGNVMLTKSGVKLLDFGLARVLEPASAAKESLTSLPTKAALTQEGTILGTFQYMAPEQLEGKDADARTDIFALGAVLYEMATGEKAFAGASQASLISAILRDEPRPIGQVVPASPPALDRVVRTCLAKDPEERWQSAGDLRRELRWIAEGSQAGSVAAAPAAVASARRSGRAARIAAALAALAAIGLGVLFLRARGARPGPVYAFLDPPPKTGWQLTGDEAAPPVVSPNGASVAFGAGGKLWVRSLRTGDVAPVTGTEGATFPFWSPDSRSLGFFSTGKLRTIEATGGPSQALADAPTPRGGTWGPDGTILYTPDFQGGLWRVSSTGGTPKAVTEVDKSKHSTHRWPWLLPDGKHVLYLAASHINPHSESSGIYVVSVDGGAPTRLLASYGSVQTVPGWLLSVSEGHLVAWPFDAGSLRVTGKARRVPAEANFDYGTWKGVFSVSQDGILVYQMAQDQTRGQLQWMDKAGRILSTVGERNNSYALRLSPDGTRASVIEGDPNSDLWVYELDRGFRTRLTSSEQVILTPLWTHDGAEILYVSGTSATVGSDYTLLRRSSFGGGKAVEIGRSRVRIEPTDISPDGKIVVVDRGAIGATTIWLYPLANPDKAAPLTESSALQTDGRISPDGRWMSFAQLQGSRFEVFVVAFPSGTERQQVSAAGGTHSRWSPDGKTLYFVSQDNELMAASVEPRGSQLRIGKAELLFPVQLFTGPRVSGAFEIAPDGKRFLINSTGNLEAPSVRIVTHWTPEPERP
jgi:Tol biopolymer transport system component